MSDVDEKGQEFDVKQVISQLITNQLNELEASTQERNHRIIFFENSTLNVTVNVGRSQTNEENGSSQVKLLDELEQVIEDNKRDFEELLTILKNKFK